MLALADLHVFHEESHECVDVLGVHRQRVAVREQADLVAGLQTVDLPGQLVQGLRHCAISSGILVVVLRLSTGGCGPTTGPAPLTLATRSQGLKPRVRVCRPPGISPRACSSAAASSKRRMRNIRRYISGKM